jgi:hypothetical protein
MILAGAEGASSGGNGLVAGASAAGRWTVSAMGVEANGFVRRTYSSLVIRTSVSFGQY